MILCLDVGNSHIFGGLYVDRVLQFQFRYPSSSPCTSDQLGVFFKNVLRENNIDTQKIKKIAICSVVPALNYSLRAAIIKYFMIDPFFLEAQATDLKIAYQNFPEIGADRVSNAIAAVYKFPGKDLIVVDLGTATTFDIISKDKKYLGGVIMPGINISMKALSENTAKLFSVHIIKPKNVIGQTTIENIQSGLYYSHLGAAREIIQRILPIFNSREPIIIGTGGFAYLFTEENMFTTIIPELVLDGLYLTALNSK